MFGVMRSEERNAERRVDVKGVNEKQDPVAAEKQIGGAAWTMGMRRWSSFAICGGASKMRGVSDEERGGTAGRRSER